MPAHRMPFDASNRPPGFRPRTTMFDALIDPDFTPVEDATVPELLNAQATAVQWLADLGAPDDVIPQEEATELARNAFRAVTDVDVDPTTAKGAILAARTPEAVRRLATMLTQYDWHFVEQANQIRGYVAAKLLDHAECVDRRISLAALKMLGSLTEVGSFTERVEVTRRDVTSDAVAERLREKLRALKAGAQDVQAKTVAE